MRDWKYWLRAVANYYKISQKDLLSGKSRAKSTFYWIIFREGLDLVQTSIALGKSKTTVVKYISSTAGKENNRYRDKSAEDYLLNKAK